MLEKERLINLFKTYLNKDLHKYIKYYALGIALHIPNKKSLMLKPDVGEFKLVVVTVSKTVTSFLYKIPVHEDILKIEEMQVGKR